MSTEKATDATRFASSRRYAARYPPDLRDEEALRTRRHRLAVGNERRPESPTPVLPSRARGLGHERVRATCSSSSDHLHEILERRRERAGAARPSRSRPRRTPPCCGRHVESPKAHRGGTCGDWARRRPSHGPRGAAAVRAISSELPFPRRSRSPGAPPGARTTRWSAGDTESHSRGRVDQPWL